MFGVLKMAENLHEYIVRSPLPPTVYPQIPISEYFAQECAKLNPYSIALVSKTYEPLVNFYFNDNYFQIDLVTEEKLTFGQLYESSQFVASALLDLGIASKDVALFYANNSLDYVQAIFAFIYLNTPQVNSTPANCLWVGSTNPGQWCYGARP